MKRKPSYVPFVLVILLGLALTFGVLWWFIENGRGSDPIAILIIPIPLLVSVIIGAVLAQKVRPSREQWYWENCKEQITEAIGPVDAPPDSVREYKVWYSGSVEAYSVWISRNDPDFKWIASKLRDAKPVKPPKPVIVKASIIAVNSVGVKNNISITKAVLGGIIAGGPGAILGGMSGTQTPGHNVFTFVVTYDNGEKHVEKVDEGTKRFHKLVEYLDD